MEQSALGCVAEVTTGQPDSKQTAKRRQDLIEKGKDAFLLRFKPGSTYSDRVIPEKELDRALDHKASDDFWDELQSQYFECLQ